MKMLQEMNMAATLSVERQQQKLAEALAKAVSTRHRPLQ